MGPLQGIRIIEFAGIGPAPFCGMMLGDMGADVIRIDRPQAARGSVPVDPRHNLLARNRRSIVLDLKKPSAIAAALRLVQRSDALIEGLRPGVMERLGLGPEVCREINPRLVYGRMTGWGQTGPLAEAAGHDINYIALSGVLHAIGLADRGPIPPLNLIGDFGGGGMMLAFGVVCALLEAQKSGKGQVIDAAMTDGSSALMTAIYGLKNAGRWKNSRESNFLDGGAHFYGCYECADGKHFAVGAIESQFYDLLLTLLGATDPNVKKQWDASSWAQQREILAQIFKTKTRDEWAHILEGTDACAVPVLDLDEAPEHSHNKARETFVTVEGLKQPAPAPRFSRTSPATPVPPRTPGADTEAVLKEMGFSADEISDAVGNE